MKKLILLFAAIVTITSYTLAQVSINNDSSSPDSSAMLDVKSTSKGILPPRMTNIQMYNISNPAAGLSIYNTTSNKPAYYNGTDWIHYDGTAVPLLVVGDYAFGGVVFWVDGSGGGLVCAVSDQSSSAEWGCFETPISGADGTAIGTGEQNTIDILAGCTTPGIAAYICDTLTLNGYTDWFLPSLDELNEMYLNKTDINTTASANGGYIFNYSLYWSSSEYDNYSAWGQNMWYDDSQVYPPKDYGAVVRAVRAF